LSQGAEPVSSSRQENAAFIKKEHEKWDGVIRRAGIKVE
jgi:hypothetical protein